MLILLSAFSIWKDVLRSSLITISTYHLVPKWTMLRSKHQSQNKKVQVLTAVLYILLVGKFYSPLVIARTPRLDAFAHASGDTSWSGLNKVLAACSAADLQIERETGHPSRGGYFDEFTSVYQIVVTPKSGEATKKTFLTGYHMQDSEAFGAPDVYANMRQGSYPTPDHNSYDFTRRFMFNA